MTEAKICPECQALLPVDAPEGLCRICLFKRGLESDTFPSTYGGGYPRWTPPLAAELAPRFPDLEIIELLGRGGMGAVYQARQKSLERMVALKILPPEVGHDVDFTERFAREAQAMARLNHPHIVTIFDFGQRDGVFFFVMEYVDGFNLRRLMEAGKFTPQEALAIVPQICEALQYAHNKGVVHRDIKPDNILMNRDGKVKIADFGLAKLVGLDASGPATERVMGTPKYMAPEQISRPNEVDHRADIYALGVVFYQMLTGEYPGKFWEPPSQKVEVDVRLDQIVLRALEKTPELRFQSASEMRTQVETFAQDKGVFSPSERAVTDQRPTRTLAKQLGMSSGTPGVNAVMLVSAILILIGVSFAVANFLSPPISPHRQDATIVVDRIGSTNHAPAEGISVLEDFDKNDVDREKWNLDSVDPKDGKVEITEGSLHYVAPAGPKGRPKFRVKSKFGMDGDFEASMDFNVIQFPLPESDSANPETNFVDMEIVVAGTAGMVYFSRVNHLGAGQGFIVFHDPLMESGKKSTWKHEASAVPKGRLRLRRIGNEMTFSYLPDGGSVYTEIATVDYGEDHVGCVSFGINVAGKIDSPFEVRIDNLEAKNIDRKAVREPFETTP